MTAWGIEGSRDTLNPLPGIKEGLEKEGEQIFSQAEGDRRRGWF